MEFDWDSDKAERNWRDHRVAFQAATRVFLDPYRIEEDDPEPSEYRQRAIGTVDGQVLFVVFTMRDSTCRLISARVAERKEHRRYHEG